LKLRYYIDTSVIGGCLDKEFKNVSQNLIEKFKSAEITAVISELTKVELKKAPKQVQKILGEIPEENQELVKLTWEAVELAEKYISHGVIGKGKLVDAEHIAIATINRVDVLVSWNFRHIVNLEKIRGYNAVNLINGYPTIEIRSPQEVIRYEE